MTRHAATFTPADLTRQQKKDLRRDVAQTRREEKPARSARKDRLLPEPAVPGHEPVLADRALERRHAGDEQDDDDHRVGGEQAADAAERDRDAAGPRSASRRSPP